MKHILFLLCLFLSGSLWATNVSYQIDIAVCDICNLQSARELALTKAPPIQCSGDPTLTEQPVCSAEMKELIVANPVALTAYKFRVQRSHVNNLGQQQQLELNWGEQQIVNRFFEIDREIREAVWAINGELGTYQQPARQFNYAEANAAPASSAADCQNSAAAHLFSSKQNRGRLQDVLRTGIANEIGQNSWRQYVTSLELTGITGGSKLIVKGGLSPSASAEVSGNFSFDVTEQSVLLRALGGSSCSLFGRFCSEDMDNIINYHVSYAGRADTRGIDKVQLEFALHPGTSRFDGVMVNLLLAQGEPPHGINIQELPPESCLAQLLKTQQDNYDQGLPSDVLSDGQISLPLDRDFGDGLGNRPVCKQTTTITVCTGTPDNMVCRPKTFHSMRLCD
ncbi:hypothetical protein ACO1PK_06505 [Alishewanella sp. d11]|uniref:hypothetical protein n=1 Tax=Alishewanella sp. d11 TaxID=3414030 RepID=UPI003BF8CC0A